MSRDAETELLDDFCDILNKYDITQGYEHGIAQDLVDLVKGRLLSADEIGFVKDTLQDIRDALNAAEESTRGIGRILP